MLQLFAALIDIEYHCGMSKKATKQRAIKGYTTAQAAELLELSTLSVQLYLRAGKLFGEKFGNTWIISKAEIVRFSKRNRIPGPVPKKTCEK